MAIPRNIIIQILISTILIVIFQQLYHLIPIVIFGHLFVVLSVSFILALIGILLQHRSLKAYANITKYIYPGLNGIFVVLLYYTYLLAFSGKSLHSRTYTLQIVLGYLKDVDYFIDYLSLNKFLVYAVLYIIPLGIITGYIIQHKRINAQLGLFKIMRDKFRKLKLNLLLKRSIVLAIVGSIMAVLALKNQAITYRLFRMEEPILTVFFKNYDPFQGQYISNSNEEYGLREAYPKNIEFNQRNVIVIIVDALRSDHLGLFGYERTTSPFLDSLYYSGSLRKVDLSFSVAGASFAGINGILRSKIWAHMGYNNFSLQHLLKDQGYHMNFLVSGDHTHFYGLKSFYGKDSDFDYYIDGSTSSDYVVADDSIIFEGLKDIAEYSNIPAYFHIHLNSVHASGIKYGKFRKYIPDEATKMDRINYLNRYDNGILQADEYIKKIFQILEYKGYLQNSIVVITSDHGEALGERGQFGHVKNVYTDQILVPMLIYDQDTVEYQNLKLATTLDVAPTIVDRLGLPIPETWEGNSLFSQGNRDFTFHQRGEHYAIICSEGERLLKYVLHSRMMKEEVFDLRVDLYERENIIESIDDEVLAELRSRLKEFQLEPDPFKQTY